ncbi:hypothetical protein P2318_19925 [Myxococcaceae bacterium GXIMD 01537]
MEEITRFMLLRPATLVEPESTTIPVRPRESLVTAIHAASGRRDSGKRLATTVGAQREKLGFGSWDSLPLARRLAQWGAALLVADDDSVSAALSSAASILGDAPSAVVASPSFAQMQAGLADWVTCDKYRGFADEHSVPAQRAYKAAFLLERLVRQPATVSSPRGVMRRTLVIGMPRPPVQPPPRSTRPAGVDIQAARATLTKAIAEHRAALAEIDTVPTHLLRSAPVVDERAEQLAPRRPLMSQALVETLSPTSRSLLQARGVRVGVDDTAAAHSRLVNALRTLTRQQSALAYKHDKATYAVIMGSGLFEIESSPAAVISLADQLSNAVPTTHATMKAVGLADLMVVRQQLMRYDATDISYIENVMIGEKRSREHKQSLITERTEVVETETTQEETRDLQTTDRNELQREASSTMKDQLSMKFGTKVSGSYGPTVQFAVNADLGIDHSKEESHKFASKVAKENTQRASTKISERFKRTLAIKTTNTTEETNIHTFDNSTQNQHVVGVYQWLDKVFEAQVFNYGLRMLFDIVIPEPAALMLHLSAKPGPSTVVKKPPTFNVTIDDIDEGSYTELATKYGAAGLEAPPEPIQTVSKVLEGVDEDAERGVTHQSADLPLPQGYFAATADVATDFWWNNVTDESGPAKVVVLVGGRRVALSSGKRTGSADLDGDQGSISVAMHSFRTPSVVATVSVTCSRTPRAVEEWKLKIYTALKQASDAQHQEYEEKLARAKAEAAEAAANPLRRSESDIRTELKRQAISMFTHQSFESFDSIDADPQSKLPEIDFASAEAEDPYIRFFEQAFEWEQMMYTCYPYFWGRTNEWRTRVLLDEPDPIFADFVKAGAARLVIPVRPHFNEAVLHFFETGQVWSGGPVPDVTSPQYVSIITEIKERTEAPGDEIPVGEPWEVRLPTQLVKLRNTPTLPTWQKGPDGKYTPVE